VRTTSNDIASMICITKTRNDDRFTTRRWLSWWQQLSRIWVEFFPVLIDMTIVRVNVGVLASNTTRRFHGFHGTLPIIIPVLGWCTILRN
jgi:hypothetical protein